MKERTRNIRMLHGSPTRWKTPPLSRRKRCRSHLSLPKPSNLSTAVLHRCLWSSLVAMSHPANWHPQGSTEYMVFRNPEELNSMRRPWDQLTMKVEPAAAPLLSTLTRQRVSVPSLGCRVTLFAMPARGKRNNICRHILDVQRHKQVIFIEK